MEGIEDRARGEAQWWGDLVVDLNGQPGQKQVGDRGGGGEEGLGRAGDAG